MPDAGFSNSKIVAAYRERTPRSARLAVEAGEFFPSGIVHDSRRIEPYAIYVARAQGARKWDVDGNEYMDYTGGHGALILGHGHPAVEAAVRRQLSRGTHPGACHELELKWAALIKRLVPAAERVRFTASGTEANLMALRLARAFTGKPKIVRFLGHFHGWLDHLAFGAANHFDGTPTPGVLPAVADNVLMAPPDDIAETRRLIESRDDIAAVILEPTGANGGQSPVGRDFVAELRRVTQERKVLLVFDEVVTGFRVSPGGAQALYGITPDLASLAKIVAGGLPGGAVVGRKDVLDLLDFEEAKRKGVEKIAHQGTYNANPLSAAAGIAALEIVLAEDVCGRASRQGAKLRALMNDALVEEGVPWAAYGDSSNFYVYTNPGNAPLDPKTFDPAARGDKALRASASHPAVNKLRLALLVHGADVSPKPGGVLSVAHGERELERTANAFRRALRMLKDEGELKD
jgi:glutamate-1-semialdehyde 2,1-aminomutase